MRLKCTIGSDTYSVFPASSLKNIEDSITEFTYQGNTYHCASYVDTDDWVGNYERIAGNESKALFTYYVDGGKQYPTATTFKLGLFEIRNFMAFANSSQNAVTGDAYCGNFYIAPVARMYLGAGLSSMSDPYCIMIFKQTINGIPGYMLTAGQASWDYVDFVRPSTVYKWGFFWVSANMVEDAVQEPYDNGNNGGDPQE